MIPHKTKLFCITVHFGAQQPTTRLIGQLEAQNSLVGGVVIVDNGPKPYHPPHASFPLRLARTGDNLGYAAGINAGLRELHNFDVQAEDIVMCCNNDVEISDTALSQIISWWRKQPLRLLAGAKSGYVNLLTGRAHIAASPSTPVPHIPYVHGSCFIANRATWRELGTLPEKFFMYWEDVALSLKAANMGISLQQLPGGIVNHADAPSRVSGIKTYYLVRNGAHLMEAATPKLWPRYWQAVNSARYVWHTLAGHQKITQALRDRKSL